MPRRLRREDYTVGWVCALPVELAAAQEMLDEEHAMPKVDAHDTNIYTCGQTGEHNTVVACLPEGQMGTNSAAAVAVQMKSTFTSIRFGLMVGIGGGVPSGEVDIRLGDIVVGKPHGVHGGAVQYDFGKATPSGFQRIGLLNTPPTVLLNAVANLRAKHMRGINRLSEYLSKLHTLSYFTREAAGPDILFEADYEHEGGATCDKCNMNRSVLREARRQEVVVHYGTIASGNQVMRNAAERDRVSAEFGGVLCFEMEAAGLMNSFPCLVIRGVCDYADSHKAKRWQAFAAGTAAAYAKEVLSVIPATEVAMSRTAQEVTRVASTHDHRCPASPPNKRRKLDSAEHPDTDIEHSQVFTTASRAQIQQTIHATPKLSVQEQDCLRSLSFPEQEYRHDDIHIARDTCDWLLEDAKYRAWMENPTGLFWIKGNPGAGKSVLMKHSVKKMREHKIDDRVVSFFFHGQGTGLQKTPLGLFRALLNSVLEYFPEHLTQLAARFEEKEKRHGSYAADRWKWTDKELQEFFTNVLTKGTHSQSVIIFVDALDECGEGPARSLLAYFKDLTYQAERVHARFKVCLSSRHYPILGLDTIPAIQVERMNEKDIRWYTQERLRDIRPKSKRQQIETEILSKSEGDFQWVFLMTGTMIDMILRGTRADKLLEELKSCPQTLNELYGTILKDLPAADQHYVVKLFQWVLFAERPLSAQELRDALAADKDMSCRSVLDLRAHEGWSDTLADFEQYVKHLSRGLVHFRGREIWEQYVPHGEDSDREAQFIHQSVADYLMDRFLNNTDNYGPTFQSQAGASHFQLSRSCLRYMTLEDILDGAHLERGVLSSRFPLAPYAVRYLFVHIQKAEKEGIIQSDLLSVMQWAPHSEKMHKLATLWRTLDPDYVHTPLGWPFIEATALHVSVAFGSISSVNASFVSNDNTIDGKDGDENTPLMLAIREGYQGVALALLDRSAHRECQCKDPDDERRFVDHPVAWGVNVNAQNKDGDTVLDIALEQDMGEVIIKILELAADLQYLGRESALVLCAIRNRQTRLLSLLIERQLNLDGAVFFALEIRPPEPDLDLLNIVSELLKAGANTAESSVFGRIYIDHDFESEDEDSGAYDHDALLLACRTGLSDWVDLLLSHDASATCENDLQECPVIIATRYGHVEIVRSLLRRAPSSADIEDQDGDTALTIAIRSRQLDLTKLLIQEGSFSVPNIALQHVFHDLVRDRVTDFVEIILQMNVINPDSIIFGITPLSLAAESGSEEIVKLLLNTNMVDVNSVESRGETPLSIAAAYGREAIVKLILDTGKVYVDREDKTGWTPLLSAMKYGYTAPVKVLFDTGRINGNSKDGRGRTLWSSAVEHGNEAIVKVLLDKGNPDENVMEVDDWTSLTRSAEERYRSVLGLLFDTGRIDGNSKDGKGRTLWSSAVEYGNDAIVKVLFEKGNSDVNVMDLGGWTPLTWAARKGYEGVLRLLLDICKADVNLNGPDQRAPLGWAVLGRHKAAVNLLLGNEDVNVNKKDWSGSTPLLCAVQHGLVDIVRLLLATGKVYVDMVDRNGMTPLMWATGYEKGPIKKLLQSYQPKKTM